jgi:acyl-CoA synthetase (AMP-forming)/AMP-acid ligase II
MLDWWGPVVIEYYAATEGGGSVITAQEWLARPGSVGKAWPGSEVRVLDDSGDDLPTGEPGLVYMRMGDSTFDYHKDREKTLASRARGMFTVGDIGYLDADGYLYLCDRKGDMIISGGVNIYPAEIEAELSCHPAVEDVAVFGIPHEEWGEEIKAVVQPADGITPGPGLTAELLGFLGGRIATFKLPRTRSCRAIPTASCTSGGSATRTGPLTTGRSDKHFKEIQNRSFRTSGGFLSSPNPSSRTSEWLARRLPGLNSYRLLTAPERVWSSRGP